MQCSDGLRPITFTNIVNQNIIETLYVLFVGNPVYKWGFEVFMDRYWLQGVRNSICQFFVEIRRHCDSSLSGDMVGIELANMLQVSNSLAQNPRKQKLKLIESTTL